MKEFFITNPKSKTENKQVETFISILKLLIKNIEETININNLEERKHLIILDSLFNDFCEHLNINSISRTTFIKLIWNQKHDYLENIINNQFILIDTIEKEKVTIQKDYEIDEKMKAKLEKKIELLDKKLENVTTTLTKKSQNLTGIVEQKTGEITNLEKIIEKLEKDNDDKSKFIDKVFHKIISKLEGKQKDYYVEFFKKSNFLPANFKEDSDKEIDFYINVNINNQGSKTNQNINFSDNDSENEGNKNVKIKENIVTRRTRKGLTTKGNNGVIPKLNFGTIKTNATDILKSSKKLMKSSFKMKDLHKVLEIDEDREKENTIMRFAKEK